MNARLAMVLITLLPAMLGGCIQINWASVHRDMSDSELSERLSKKLNYGMSEEQVRHALRKLSIQPENGPWSGQAITATARDEALANSFRWIPDEGKIWSQSAYWWVQPSGAHLNGKEAIMIRLIEPGTILLLPRLPSGDCVVFVLDEQERLAEVVRADMRARRDPFATGREEDIHDRAPRYLALTPESVP